MQDKRNGNRPEKRRIHIDMTGTTLKVIACIIMALYTFSVSVMENGLIHIGDYDTTTLSEALSADAGLMALSGWASVLQLVGGLAVPVFAFLLVEGFRHTSSYRRYLLTMLVFAVVSEVPYDLAMSGTLFTLNGQNALFSMAICLVMLYGLRMFVERKGAFPRLAQLIIVFAAMLWCDLLHSGFGMCTVLLTAVYYLLYEHKGGRLLAGVGVCLVSGILPLLMGYSGTMFYLTGVLSVYLLWTYSGARGRSEGGRKYLFYAFYPGHLLLLGLVSLVVGGVWGV